MKISTGRLLALARTIQRLLLFCCPAFPAKMNCEIKQVPCEHEPPFGPDWTKNLFFGFRGLQDPSSLSNPQVRVHRKRNHSDEREQEREMRQEGESAERRKPNVKRRTNRRTNEIWLE